MHICASIQTSSFTSSASFRIQVVAFLVRILFFVKVILVGIESSNDIQAQEIYGAIHLRNLLTGKGGQPATYILFHGIRIIPK